MRIYVGLGSDQYLVCTFETCPTYDILYNEVQAHLVRNQLTHRFDLRYTLGGDRSKLFYKEIDEDGMKILISSDDDIKHLVEQVNNRNRTSMSSGKMYKIILHLERSERSTLRIGW
jgi:hypothetical protein